MRNVSKFKLVVLVNLCQNGCQLVINGCHQPIQSMLDSGFEEDCKGQGHGGEPSEGIIHYCCNWFACNVVVTGWVVWHSSLLGSVVFTGVVCRRGIICSYSVWCITTDMMPSPLSLTLVSKVEDEKVWPAWDCPLSSWFQKGKAAPFSKYGIVHVVQYSSGWRQYSPAHAGVEKLLLGHSQKFKQVAKRMQLEKLKLVLGPLE